MAVTFIKKPAVVAADSEEYSNPLLAGEGVLGQISYPKVKT